MRLLLRFTININKVEVGPGVLSPLRASLVGRVVVECIQIRHLSSSRGNIPARARQLGAVVDISMGGTLPLRLSNRGIKDPRLDLVMREEEGM